jgi:putative ABC transport system permease protein
MFKVALKSLLGHKLRMLLTGIAIVLGTAFLSGSYILTDTVKKTFTDLFSQVGQNVDAIVAGPTVTPGDDSPDPIRVPLDQSVLEDVRAVEGVGRAEADITGIINLVNPADNKSIGSRQAPKFAFAWSEDPDFSSVTVLEGRGPEAVGETAIDEITLKNANLRVGDKIRINAKTSAEATIVGSLKFGSDTRSLAGASLAFFVPEQAQELLALQNKVSSVAVIADDATSPTQLTSNLTDAFPDLFVQSGQDQQQAQADSINEGLGFFGIFLSSFGFIALFVGSILIVNTFQIIIAQRSKELAVLRAVGARRSQIFRSVILEALAIGLFFSAVGAGVGALIARGFIEIFKAFDLELPIISLSIGSNRIITTILVGVVVTLLASIVPSIQASRVEPVAALRDEVKIATSAKKSRLFVGALLSLGAIAGIIAGVSNEKIQLLGLGALALLLAVLALSPIIAPAILKVVAYPFTKLLGLSTDLGARNAERNPRRTAITAYALVIGVSLVVAISVLVSSVVASFDKVLSDAVKSDFSVSAANSNGERLSPSIANLLKENPAFSIVSPVRTSSFAYDGKAVIFVALDTQNIDEVYVQEIAEGRGLATLGLNELVVRRETAESRGWTVGDDIPVEFGLTGNVTLKLVGLSEQTGPQGIDYIMSNETINANVDTSTQQDDFIFIKGQPGVDKSETRKALDEALKPFPEARSFSLEQLIDEFSKQLNQFATFIQVLLIFSILIAFFGVINTLLLSITERTRELGLLRAVGATRRQIKRMVRLEAIFTVALGITLGLVIGLILSYAFVRTLASQGLGEFAVPTGLIVACVVLTPIIGILAAVFPAWRASRMNVLAAIQQI